jgi:aminoglycoside phosphotransferase (APT) family kinase protein
VDAALLRLVRGLIPVPEVVEVRRAVAALDRPGLLVTSYVEGERGDQVLPRLDDEGLAVLGRSCGRIAGELAGMPTVRPGPFLDSDLAIGSFELHGGLPEFVELHGDSLERVGWDPPLLGRLRALAVTAQGLLDTSARSCLVHSDLNPKNLLIDPVGLSVTAVLDWEFAHSGHPTTDLGNLLRFDRAPAYVAAVLSAYCELRGTDPDATLELARAADLWALVDLAARAGENPVADRADRHLRAIADTGDLHAVPDSE